MSNNRYLIEFVRKGAEHQRRANSVISILKHVVAAGEIARSITSGISEFEVNDF